MVAEKKEALPSDPYRDPSPPVDGPAPVVGPLAGFARHERALAMIDVYRQSIAACTSAKSLGDLKLIARNDVDILLPKAPPKEPQHSARGSVLDAVTWLHGLTLDDTVYFRPKVAVESKAEDYLAYGRWFRGLVMGGVLGYILGHH